MAKPNNNSIELIKNRLSIQIGLSGLSFSILDSNSKSIIKSKHFNKERNLNPFEMLDYLKFVLDSENLENSSYSQVHLIYRNELFTLVPKAYFDKNLLSDYLKFNNKILTTDYIAFDEINKELVSVYVPLININNYIFETFGSFTYKHFNTLFIDYVLTHYKNEHVLIHTDNNMFEMIVLSNNKIIHTNTFLYSTKEDFIYYILFSLEQLQKDSNSIQITFFGDISEESELYQIAYKYIRNVEIGKESFPFNINGETNSSKSNIALLTSFLCESSQESLKAEE